MCVCVWETESETQLHPWADACNNKQKHCNLASDMSAAHSTRMYRQLSLNKPIKAVVKNRFKPFHLPKRWWWKRCSFSSSPLTPVMDLVSPNQSCVQYTCHTLRACCPFFFSPFIYWRHCSAVEEWRRRRRRWGGSRKIRLQLSGKKSVWLFRFFGWNVTKVQEVKFRSNSPSQLRDTSKAATDFYQLRRWWMFSPNIKK